VNAPGTPPAVDPDWLDHVVREVRATTGVEVCVEEESFSGPGGGLERGGVGPPTLDVPADRWVDVIAALAHDLGYRYFDWLSAVDELDQGFAVVCHVAKLGTESPEAQPLRHLLVRTRVPREAPVLRSVTGIYAGAAWHERETHEMFGIDFAGHPNLAPLLLPEEFEGHPLRKDFVLAARAAKPWPGAKEPGESDESGPAARRGRRGSRRRRLAPPGVPAPDEWGPRPPDRGGDDG